jgi:hypothetical protein
VTNLLIKCELWTYTFTVLRTFLSFVKEETCQKLMLHNFAFSYWQSLFFNFLAATNFELIGVSSLYFIPKLLLLDPYVSGYHANHVVFSITLIKTASRSASLLVWQVLKRRQMECEGRYVLCPSLYLHVYVLGCLFTP